MYLVLNISPLEELSLCKEKDEVAMPRCCHLRSLKRVWLCNSSPISICCIFEIPSLSCPPLELGLESTEEPIKMQICHLYTGTNLASGRH